MDLVFIKRSTEDLMVNYLSMMIIDRFLFQSIKEQKRLKDGWSGIYLEFQPKEPKMVGSGN